MGSPPPKFKIKTKKTSDSSRKSCNYEPLKPPKKWKVRTIALKSNFSAYLEDLPRQKLIRAFSHHLETEEETQEMSLVENEYWGYCMEQNDFQNLTPKILPEYDVSDLSCMLDGPSQI